MPRFWTTQPGGHAGQLPARPQGAPGLHDHQVASAARAPLVTGQHRQRLPALRQRLEGASAIAHSAARGEELDSNRRPDQRHHVAWRRRQRIARTVGDARPSRRRATAPRRLPWSRASRPAPRTWAWAGAASPCRESTPPRFFPPRPRPRRNLAARSDRPPPARARPSGSPVPDRRGRRRQTTTCLSLRRRPFWPPESSLPRRKARPEWRTK